MVVNNVSLFLRFCFCFFCVICLRIFALFCFCFFCVICLRIFAVLFPLFLHYLFAHFSALFVYTFLRYLSIFAVLFPLFSRVCLFTHFCVVCFLNFRVVYLRIFFLRIVRKTTAAARSAKAITLIQVISEEAVQESNPRSVRRSFLSSSFSFLLSSSSF